MATLVTIHSWVRWLVLLGVVAGVVVGFLRYRDRAEWSPHLLQAEVMIVDIQVAIGASIWIFFEGRSRGFFFSVLHPVMMLTALAVLHVSAALTRRRHDARSWLTMSAASAIALVMIVGAIPWNRLTPPG